MLKSCKYCGKIVEYNHICSKKPIRKKQGNNKDKFRSTSRWNKKRIEIRERDKYLCQICVRKLYDTVIQYNYNYLEVHHSIPLEKDYEKCLDNDNLITLCERHHEMAERGEIPYKEIKFIIDEQEKTTNF